MYNIMSNPTDLTISIFLNLLSYFSMMVMYAFNNFNKYEKFKEQSGSKFQHVILE